MSPGDIAPVIVTVTLFLTAGSVLILRGPLGRALADRIGGRAGASDPEVPRLRQDVEDLRAALSAVQERLDFTERLLARERERGQLPKGAGA
jgi:hypothetical protein